MEEHGVFPRFLLQVGDGMFSLADIRGSNINGRIVIQESLFNRVISRVVGARQKTVYLCRVLADLVVWVGDHDHLAGEVWEVVELPPGLPELLRTDEMEARGVSARGRLRCEGGHGGRKSGKWGRG